MNNSSAANAAELGPQSGSETLLRALAGVAGATAVDPVRLGSCEGDLHALAAKLTQRVRRQRVCRDRRAGSRKRVLEVRAGDRDATILYVPYPFE